MARPCSICTSDHAAEVRRAVLAGETDAVIAGRFGFAKSSVGRHRRDHIQAQARAMAKAAARGHDMTLERRAVAKATSGDAKMWLALESITSDLRRVHDRLDRAADEAAEAKQHMSLAALSGQATKVLETRARLGGVAGSGGPGAGGGFQLRIFLGEKAPVVIEGSAVEPAGGPDVEIS